MLVMGPDFLRLFLLLIFIGCAKSSNSNNRNFHNDSVLLPARLRQIETLRSFETTLWDDVKSIYVNMVTIMHQKPNTQSEHEEEEKVNLTEDGHEDLEKKIRQVRNER
eukprot:UN01158